MSRNINEEGGVSCICLRLGLLICIFLVSGVKGDAVEVIELGNNWTISNRNGCKC